MLFETLPPGQVNYTEGIVQSAGIASLQCTYSHNMTRDLFFVRLVPVLDRIFVSVASYQFILILANSNDHRMVQARFVDNKHL